jgi:RNA polymerase sigma-70 factor (ECF subfamily)
LPADAADCKIAAMAIVQEHPGSDEPGGAPGTLGDVLYAGMSSAPGTETDWVGLVREIAAGDQVALHGLYERSHRLVFTLLMRITSSRETAEELTLEVFHDVWRRAYRYDPREGTVLGWLMNRARFRALDRLRSEPRMKRAEATREPAEFEDERRALRSALDTLTPEERQVIETAFFSELTHAEVAIRLKESLEVVRTRMRSGLHKLRQALAEGGRKP